MKPSRQPEEETEPSDEGVVVNDTGVSYIEQDDL